jgi:hypothetical protein
LHPICIIAYLTNILANGRASSDARPCCSGKETVAPSRWIARIVDPVNGKLLVHSHSSHVMAVEARFVLVMLMNLTRVQLSHNWGSKHLSVAWDDPRHIVKLHFHFLRSN